MRFSGLVLLGVLAGVAPSACVYDPDQPCGPHQVKIDNDRCACEAGFVPGSAGCVACGESEQESNGECICIDGFAKSAAGVCAEIPAELGAACDASSPCPEGSKYPLCHLSAGAGYCTSSCTSSDDCDGGYKCHDSGADSFCRRPPTGHGDDCKSDDDCAGGEATFCETIQTNICLVPCSTGNTEVCFEGEVCCDFAVFHPICVPSDSCTSMTGTQLE